MASLGKIKLEEVAPNHPFANTFISFGMKRPPSSTDASAPSDSAPTDPMLPAMDGLEQALKDNLAKTYQGTESQPLDQSVSEESTTPPGNEAA